MMRDAVFPLGMETLLADVEGFPHGYSLAVEREVASPLEMELP